MARIEKHTRAERLIIARVSGIVSRYASRRPLDIAGAVAQLHALTTDPHLLGHAWPADAPQPGFTVFTNAWMAEEREILTAAGADPQPRWWVDQR